MPEPIYVAIDETGRAVTTYLDGGDPTKRTALEAGWKRFTRPDPASGKTYNIWYRSTNRNLEVQVDRLLPPGTPAGRYRVEAFIPGKHATTRQGIFSVAHSFRTENGQLKFEDTVTVVDMFNLFDVWAPLGEYDLDPSKEPLSGRVRQYDLSIEDPPVEAAFGPVRWMPVVPRPAGSALFDAPIGTQEEREGKFVEGGMAFGLYPIWVGRWYDANPFLSWYNQGYHTGADLNLPGSSDADKDAPIYAVADGTVTFAGPAGSWGNIVVIEHPEALVTLPDGHSQHQRVYSRYGHVSDRILVKAGQPVTRGQNIAFIGLQANFVTGWHLHFDVNYSDMFKSRPAHWPNMTRIRELQKANTSPKNPEFINAQAAVKKEVIAHYLDPLRFLKDNHS